MSLAPFHIDGKPNPEALMQQAFLVMCIYQNQRKRAEEWLATKGSFFLDSWVWRPDKYPPSYFIFHEDQEDLYYIVIAGTTSVWQCREHLAQSNGVKVEGGCFEHGFFQAAKNEILNDFDKLTKTSGDLRIRLSGHSYGSCTAHLISIPLATRYLSKNVELLTFAEPRAVTIDPRDTRPHAILHSAIAHEGDCVQRLPPSYFDLFWKIPGEAAIKHGKFAGIHLWGHYAKEYVFRFFDRLVLDKKQDEWALRANNWEATIASLHYMKTYIDSTAGVYIATYKNAADFKLIKLAQQTAAEPEAQDEGKIIQSPTYIHPEMLNPPWESQFGGPMPAIRTDAAPGFRYIAPGVKIQRKSSQPGNASNITSSFGENMAVTNYIVTQFINNSKFGFSEKHALASGNTEAQAVEKALSLAYLRSWMLGNNVADIATPTVKCQECPVIEFVRLSSALSPDIGRLLELDPSSYGGPRGIVGNYSDVFSTALTVNLYSKNVADPTKTYRTTLTIRGMADDVTKGGRYNGDNVDVTVSKKWSKMLKNYLDLLVSGPYGAMVHSLDKPWRQSASVTVNNVNNNVRITYTNHGLAQGETVHLRGTKQREYLKQWKVNVGDANTFDLQGSQYISDNLPAGLQFQASKSPTGEKYLQFAGYYSYTGNPKVSKGRSAGGEFLGVSFGRR